MSLLKGPISGQGAVLWALASLFLFACGDEGIVTEAPSPTQALDQQGPSIVPVLVPDGQARDVDVAVEATITDPSGVAFSAVYFRAVGVDFWASEALTHAGDNLYVGHIPANYVGEAGVDYYFEARDGSPNRNISQYPDSGAAYSLYFSTLSDPQGFPYETGFEPEDEVERWLLGETGWTSYVRGFADGFNWQLSDRFSGTGAYSVFHDHGSPYQSLAFEDWLVSPPIDLTQAETVDLYWTEFLDHPEYANHRLMVSLGSADPANQHYVEVLNPLLPSASDEWLQSQHVDLSQFAGAPQVFIAFVYEGLWADDWYIDDLVLDIHKADLELVDVEFLPQAIQPGQGSALSLTAYNRGLAASGPLTVTVEALGDGVTVEPTLMQIDGVEAGAKSRLEDFTVSVLDDFNNHSYAELQVSFDDGNSIVSDVVRLQVGQPPIAHVEVSHEFENDIQLYIGYGDPDFPTWFDVIQADGGEDGSGLFSWDVDLFDQRHAMPPNTEENQWFVEVWDDSPLYSGTLDAFTLMYGDDVFEAEALPRVIPDDGQIVRTFIPGRAELQLAQIYVQPVQVGPGDAVTLNFDVYNLASEPNGPIRGELVSTEPHVQVLLPQGEVDFNYTPVTGSSVYGVVTPPGSYSFTVDAEHINSKQLNFTLLLRDDIDIWTLPINVEVPYPVYGHLILATEDYGGSVDAGTPTPTEGQEEGVTRSLVVRAKNLGDLQSFADISVEVVVLDAMGAEAIVGPGPHILKAESGFAGEVGGLSAQGLGTSSAIPITVYGADFDTLLTLKITVSDGVVSHSDERIISVIDPPWNDLLAEPDSIGDHGASSLDLISGQFWYGGTFLRMQWTTNENIDPLNTIFYAYLSSSSSHRYAYVYLDGEVYGFRWVDQGDGNGYFTRNSYPPESLNIYLVDNKTMEFSLDLTDISYQSRDLYGGASVGDCEPLNCDDAPNELQFSGNLEAFWWW